MTLINGARATPGDPARWPLACRLASYGKYEDAAWTHLPSLDVHYLFLSVPALDQVDAVMERLEKNKLKPLVLRGAADLSLASSAEELAVQLSTCRRMGVRFMFLSPKHGDTPKSAVFSRLREAGDAARSFGVTISLETHPDLGTNGDVHLETMKAVDHPNVRVNFDTGNITYYNRDRNAVDELEKVIDYVATVELKDHDGGFESWVFPPLGRGVVDFPGVLRVLSDHGYSGPVTLEFEGVKGVELDEAGTGAAIEDSIRYIRSIGSFL
jgi:sugar phosphate isomerase/epimerase